MKVYFGFWNGLDYVVLMLEVILFKVFVRVYIDEMVSSRYGGCWRLKVCSMDNDFIF